MRLFSFLWYNGFLDTINTKAKTMNIHNVIKANVIKSAWKDTKNIKAKKIMLAYAERLKKGEV